MAIIVDKVQKRKDIALACKELFFQRGINDLTISEVAKTAGVGKGTIYEYFNNKEEIVFEIVNIFKQHFGGDIYLLKTKKMYYYTSKTNESAKEIINYFDLFFLQSSKYCIFLK